MKNIKKTALTLLCISAIASSINALGADFQTGLAAAQKGDYATALREWKALAEQGDAMAQYSLALMHDQEKGVAQDYQTALEWYRLAAEQGHVNAQNNLALMYDQGRGVVQNDQMAVKWYRRAAEQGHVNAQFNLAVMYQIG